MARGRAKEKARVKTGAVVRVRAMIIARIGAGQW